MTPVEYFYLFFDNQFIDIIRNQTDLNAAKTGCQATSAEEEFKRYIFHYLGVQRISTMTRKRFEKCNDSIRNILQKKVKKKKIGY